jgi:hypothetical protein
MKSSKNNDVQQKISLKSNSVFDYLSNTVLSEYSVIKVKSENGRTIFMFNHLVMASLSEMLFNIFYEEFDTIDEIVISTDISEQELTLVHNFVMEGILPQKIDDILADKLDIKLENLFKKFGIDLSAIIRGQVPMKKEIIDHQDVYNDDIFEDDFKLEKVLSEKIEIVKIENLYFNDDIENENEENPRVSGRRRSGRIKRNYEEIQSDFEKVDDNVIKKSKKPSKIRTISLKKEKKSDDSDWNPTSQKEIQNEEEEKEKDESKISRRKPRKSTTNYGAKFSKIRGLMCRYRARHYTFMSHDKLLQYQKDFETTFVIQIPDPDFTEEEFDNFKFPTDLKDLTVTPKHVNIKKQDLTKANAENECCICGKKCKSKPALSDHNIKAHTIHYVCPFERCDRAFQVRGSDPLFKFARHVFFHNRY